MSIFANSYPKAHEEESPIRSKSQKPIRRKAQWKARPKVYIWKYANPCKLTFTWWVFFLGFRFVYMQEVEKYFYNKKWKVVIHVTKKCRKLYCTIESFAAQQKVLLHSRKLYYTSEKSALWQKLEKSSFCGRNKG